MIDLTKIPASGVFGLDDIIVQHEEPVKKEKKYMECVKCRSKGNWHRSNTEGVICYFCFILGEAPAPVSELLREAYNRPCEFCGDKESRHFDHINMFVKRDTIPRMIHQPINDIQNEILVCQLLCVPCHAKVTAAERRHGFFKKKIALNKCIRKGDDVTALLSHYKEEYDIVMSQEYVRIKYEVFWDLFGGGG